MVNGRYLGHGAALFHDGAELPLSWAAAETFIERLCGLMLKRRIPLNSALLFENCRSIHMMFMRVPLDVLWVYPKHASGEGRRDFKVVRLDSHVKPWRVSTAPPSASAVMEFPAGTFERAPESICLFTFPS